MKFPVQKTLFDEEVKQKVKFKTSPIMPKGEFTVIYADPAWKYNFSKTKNRKIENHYPTMELKDICNLKVPSAKDSILFLWCTAPKLYPEGMEVMKAWGFTYKSNMVWDKMKMGMGFYFRIEHEHLLIGTKGKMKTPDEKNRFRSVFRRKRSKKHSEKPKDLYKMIEIMYPNEKYLELFARNKRKNWEAWGNEI